VHRNAGDNREEKEHSTHRSLDNLFGDNQANAGRSPRQMKGRPKGRPP
jgi:hypothetical protein